MGLTRTFVAIEIPEGAAHRIAALARGLKAGRTVPPENLHMTLAFLGDLTDEALDELDAALRAIRLPPVTLMFDGFGTFGDARPRALWLGVRPADDLLRLQKAVERAATQAGCPPERRRFVPHVTLTRFRGWREEAEALGAFLTEAGAPRVEPLTAVAFSLVASRLRPDGAEYETLALYPLTA